MAYSEFVEHAAYYEMEPWGDDWRQASVVAWSAVQPHSRKRFSPDDFLPQRVKPRRPKQTPQQMVSILNMLANQGVISRGECN